MRAAILASGNGSNFEAIMQSIESNQLEIEISLVFSDKGDAYVLERGKSHQVPTVSFSPKEFSSKQEYEIQLLRLFEDYQVDWLILAGYMRLVGPSLLAAFPQRVINIHPSLLPKFPGLHGIQDAFSAGVAKTGVTIHYVDEGLDTGPIIAQEKVSILPEDTIETLEEKIHKVEHRLYPKILSELASKERRGK